MQKALLFSKKPEYFASENYERRNPNSKDLTYTGLSAAQQTLKKQLQAKDLNIDDRISLFKEQLKNEFVYGIRLRYFSDIRKNNFPTKIDYRINLFLETNMDKLFESRKVLAANTAIPDVDAEIFLTRAPFVQYKQILLEKNFRQHLETIKYFLKSIKNGCSENTNTKDI